MILQSEQILHIVFLNVPYRNIQVQYCMRFPVNKENSLLTSFFFALSPQRKYLKEHQILIYIFNQPLNEPSSGYRS